MDLYGLDPFGTVYIKELDEAATRRSSPLLPHELFCTFTPM